MTEWDELPWYEARIYRKGFVWEGSEEWEDEAELPVAGQLEEQLADMGLTMRIVRAE